jgi:hypothetical protein
MPIKDEQLMRSSISLYRDNFKTIILYAFVSMLPTLLISVIFGVVGKPSPEHFPSLSTPILLVTGVLFLAAIFSTLWVSLALLRVIAKRYRGESVLPFWQEISAVTPRVLPLIGSSICSVLAVVTGLILFIIPGIIVALWFAFSDIAVAIDGTGPIDSLKESKKIVEGRWFTIAGKLLVIGFVFGLPIWISNSVFSALGTYFINLTTNADAKTIIGILVLTLNTFINILFAPLFTIGKTIIYIEGKKDIIPMVQPTTPAPQM